MLQRPGPGGSLDQDCCNLFYLEDQLLDPGSLRQEVQHGETRVVPDGRHGHPVTSAGTRPDVVGETRQVVDERLHPTFVQTCNVNPDMERPDLNSDQTLDQNLDQNTDQIRI